MERSFYLDLAAGGLRMPIGAHLVLHEQPDPLAVVYDGRRLGQVIVETARRFQTPLAIPLMDLGIEKALLLGITGIPVERIATYHFDAAPDENFMAELEPRLAAYCDARLESGIEALASVAREPGLLPIGMAIGPFSLMTKLVADPIATVFMAGRGMTAAERPRIAILERVLELASRVVEWSARKQCAAGAKAVVICEPAAGTAFISPRQMAAGADVFERYVMTPHRRLKAVLDECGADLILHDCAEISDEMLRRLVALDPAILSLGSTRALWEIAALVPPTTVLFGNLPTKQFYSDADMSVAEVERRTRELLEKMEAANRPFILGSECDVLSVEGREEAIKGKVEAFMRSGCG